MMPIAFRAASVSLDAQQVRFDPDFVRLCTHARALDGMQKEALVEHQPTGVVWRLLCDEGPWLNGTDQAPFPLGYFAAGLASSLLSDIVAEAAGRNVPLDAPRLRVHIYFTMQGSLLKGTMAAGVDRIEVTVDGGARADATEVATVAAVALSEHSAINRVLEERLPSRFFTRLNGETLANEDGGPGQANADGAPDPLPLFGEIREETGIDIAQPVIRKVEAASPGPAQDAIGLQAEQKRTVHLYAEALLRPDGFTEIAVECLQPRGSRFVLMSDEVPDAGGARRAPCGLTYLSAGVAFCFMTQLGRYAQIRKLRLRDYRIVQDTAFARRGPGGPAASGVATWVWLDGDDSPADSLRMVRTGEQTCYLHTTFRERVIVSVSTGSLR
jgi:uncharacterized OsmC-like protein